MKTEVKENFGIKGQFRVIKTDSLTGKVLYRSPVYDNIVVIGANLGKDLILDRMNADNTYTLNITYLDIGTSNQTPVSGDTGLIAGVARTQKVTGVVSGNQLTLRFFFASANLANGTYNEIGTFVDGTVTLASGRLFSRALFGSPLVKGTNEDITIEYIYTIN